MKRSMNKIHCGVCFYAIPLLAIALLLPAAGWAQAGTVRLVGTVYDQAGAVIPGAAIVVTDTRTNKERSSVSDEAGSFSFPLLDSGTYSVKVTKEGFKKALRSSVTLEVDQRAEINIVLETGAVTETVEVSSQAPLVDTTTATFGKVIENRRVQELPLNGRNALSLVLLSYSTDWSSLEKPSSILARVVIKPVPREKTDS